jgi:glucuronosyltransferase
MLLAITKLVFLLWITSSVNFCHGAKILAVFPTPSKSHWILGQPLMKELARAGHEVTVMSPFQAKNPPKNYRHIEMKAAEKMYEGEFVNIINEKMSNNSKYFK